ncbi:PilZ domain-containing protein [Methylorubrum extorquens]|nr:PilZ domain-containing protein [Methylorubrum extorquens]
MFQLYAMVQRHLIGRLPRFDAHAGTSMSNHAGFLVDAPPTPGEPGLIAVDEHTSIGCWVHDISAQDVEIVVPDASLVPDVFLLTSSAQESIKVCRTLWRIDEMIGARHL